MFLVLCGRVITDDAWSDIGKPDDAVTVGKDAVDGCFARTDYFGFLSVGERKDLAGLCSSEDVVSIGIQTGDVLVKEIALSLDGHVTDIQTMYAFVCSKPYIIHIAFGHRSDGHVGSRDEL